MVLLEEIEVSVKVLVEAHVHQTDHVFFDVELIVLRVVKFLEVLDFTLLSLIQRESGLDQR